MLEPLVCLKDSNALKEKLFLIKDRLVQRLKNFDVEDYIAEDENLADEHEFWEVIAEEINSKESMNE